MPNGESPPPYDPFHVGWPYTHHDRTLPDMGLLNTVDPRITELEERVKKLEAYLGLDEDELPGED